MQVSDRLSKATADLTLPVGLYIAVVVFAAAAAAVALTAAGTGVENWPGVIALAVVAAMAERGGIALRGKLNVSISLLPAVFAAVLFGPLAAMIVFGASVVGLSIPLAGRVAYLSTRALTGAAAAGAASGAAAVMSGGIGGIIASATLAALVAEVLDACFASTTHRLRGNGRWRDAAGELFPVIAASVPLYSPAVALLVLAYRDVSPWTLPLFFAPALLAQRWFLLYEDQRRLAADLGRANEQLKAANLSFAKGLIATLDARDQYTAGHSAAVAIYARDIA